MPHQRNCGCTRGEECNECRVLDEYGCLIHRAAPPLTDAERRLLAQVPPEPLTVPLLDALKAARDVIVALANQAGIVPGQHGYSSVQTDTERKAWQAVGDIDAILAAACLDSQGRTP